MELDIRPLSKSLAAEIGNIDLAKPISEETFAALRHAWYQYLVLIFPDQKLSKENHMAFSRRWGELEIHPAKEFILEDYPEILHLTNRRDGEGRFIGLRDGGSIWHSDLSYMTHPSSGSLLYAIEIPQDGGDTEWANMYLAYDALPNRLKDRIFDLKAVHQFDIERNPRVAPPKDFAVENAKGSIWEKRPADKKPLTKAVVHPLIRSHPKTGRTALYVNRRFTTHILDLSEYESEDLLIELFDYAEAPAHIYHHRWNKNQLVIWDNRCTIHLACGGVPADQFRTMHRTSVRGEVPVA